MVVLQLQTGQVLASARLAILLVIRVYTQVPTPAADQYENLNAVYDIALDAGTMTITGTSFDGSGTASQHSGC